MGKKIKEYLKLVGIIGRKGRKVLPGIDSKDWKWTKMDRHWNKQTQGETFNYQKLIKQMEKQNRKFYTL